VNTNGERKVAQSSLPYIQIAENQSSLSVEAKPPIGSPDLPASVNVTAFFFSVTFLTEMKENDNVITATARRETINLAFILIKFYIT